MSPLLITIGTWYGVRDSGIDECLEIVEMLINSGADLRRTYTVDIAGEISEVTALDYTRKLAGLFPDKPFGKVVEVLKNMIFLSSNQALWWGETVENLVYFLNTQKVRTILVIHCLTKLV